MRWVRVIHRPYRPPYRGGDGCESGGVGHPLLLLPFSPFFNDLATRSKLVDALSPMDGFERCLAPYSPHVAIVIGWLTGVSIRSTI
ncbi:hypothetical protein EBZ35_05240 [bacterium]|nr:hypothetical protein [bacterium]